MTVVISSICWLCLLLFQSFLSTSNFYHFFIWYPFILLVSLPYNHAKARLQAKNDFIKIIQFQAIFIVAYLGFLITNLVSLRLPIQFVFAAYLAALGLASIIVFPTRWAGVSEIKYIQKDRVRNLHAFGVYSLGSNMGGILLKNAPVLIIGMMLMTASVATFSVPFKLIGVFSIPLEGCAIVALNKMSASVTDHENYKVVDLYYQYVGVLMILFLPFILLFFCFPEIIIYLFAGAEYVKTATSINIFRILLFYILLLPIGRLSGTVLDSMNRPFYNFRKVLAILLFNVSGVVLVLLMFRTLESVAVVCIATIILDAFLGVKFMNRDIKINITRIIFVGWDTIKHIFYSNR